MKPDNVLPLSTTLDKLFKNWFTFLKPIHSLTNKEMDVAAAFLKQRYFLGKAISDDAILDKVVMNEDTKRTVREECHITLPHFQVIMGKLRKNGIIVDNKISPRYIPRINEENNSLQLLIYFQIK